MRVGCGGILRSPDGIIRAMFLGPVPCSGLDFANLFALKVAAQVFIEAGREGKVYLVLESNSKVVFNFLSNPVDRPRV
ncbi:hypothetical protein V6N12_006697 [Hibiscus sabdariffa]|uniref:RNase H type-1 domain-containing protein n=1 Tax=Hibiscus sabdariffa TaxID=183260 RepID=A0ABR2EZM6_9ROSI